MVGTDARRHVGRARRVGRRAALPPRASLPLHERRLRRVGSTRRPGPRRRLVRGLAPRPARAARHGPHDEAAHRARGARSRRAPLADVLLPEPEHDAGAMGPAGQLWTTIEDLARWAAFLAGDTGELLAADTLEEMCEPHLVVDDQGVPWTGAHGIGWQVFNVDGRRYAGHGGSMPGFVAELRVARDTGDGVVVLTNTTSSPAPRRLVTALLAGLEQHALPPGRRRRVGRARRLPRRRAAAGRPPDRRGRVAPRPRLVPLHPDALRPRCRRAGRGLPRRLAVVPAPTFSSARRSPFTWWTAQPGCTKASEHAKNALIWRCPGVAGGHHPSRAPSAGGGSVTRCDDQALPSDELSPINWNRCGRVQLKPDRPATGCPVSGPA